MIQRVLAAREALKGEAKIAYLPNYDTAAGWLMTAGVDLWLNTPQPPNEASGTSGMKAAPKRGRRRRALRSVGTRHHAALL